MSNEPIWHATLDSTWSVSVISGSDSDRGVLQITDQRTGAIRHTTLVPLTYGAIFGPDIDDVTAWQQYVIDWVDTEGFTKHDR